jgi:hypothetical protein
MAVAIREFSRPYSTAELERDRIRNAVQKEKVNLISQTGLYFCRTSADGVDDSPGNALGLFRARLSFFEAGVKLQGRRLVETAGGKLNHGFDLFAIEAVMPLYDVVEIGSRLKVLEDGRHRHPRALQHPSAAHLAENALHRKLGHYQRYATRVTKVLDPP